MQPAHEAAQFRGCEPARLPQVLVEGHGADLAIDRIHHPAVKLIVETARLIHENSTGEETTR